MRSFLPAQAPPSLAWIAVRSDPAHAAAAAAAQAAEEAAEAAAKGGRGAALAAVASSAAGAAAASSGAAHPTDNRSCAEREEGAMTDWAVHDSMGTCSAVAAQQIGRRWGLLSGKWMVFVNAASEGAIWPAVAKAVYARGLCHSAKIAAGPVMQRGKGEARRVICIYTNDFSDREDVMGVHRGLKAVLRAAMPEHKWGTISYKPDIYTTLGIYYPNQWKIKPTLYSAKV